MKRNFFILLITAVSFTACSDTLCFGDDCETFEMDYSGGMALSMILILVYLTAI